MDSYFTEKLYFNFCGAFILYDLNKMSSLLFGPYLLTYMHVCCHLSVARLIIFVNDAVSLSICAFCVIVVIKHIENYYEALLFIYWC